MATSRRKGRCRIWLICGCTALLALPAPSLAQSQTVRIDIPEQSLATALRHFGRQTRTEVIFSPSVVRGKKAAPVSGQMAPEQALQRLLQGSGLRFRRTGQGTVVVEAPSSASTEIRPAPGAVASGGAGPRDATAASPADEYQEADIIVTGTLIRGAAPAGAHLITHDQAYIDSTGQATLHGVLNSVPQNFSGAANEVAVLTARAGLTGAAVAFGSSVNLRGLGADATLTLVNNRRVAPSGFATFVDISMIPVTAIDRIEILADGASATYGSDALAGVVNVILRRRFEGAETRLRYGAADNHHDLRAGQTFGLEWGAGHILVSGEYYKQSPLDAADRKFTASADLRPFGGTDTRTNQCNPGNITAPASLAGAIPSGQDGTALTSGAILRGQVNRCNQNAGEVLPGQKRISGFVDIAQNIAAGLELYANGLYSRRKAAVRSGPGLSGPLRLSLSVPPSNAFRQLSGLGGRTGNITVAYSLLEDLEQLAKVSASSETYLLTGGARVDLADSWRLESALTYGRNVQRSSQSVIDARPAIAGGALNLALASSNPATAFNPFGEGSNTSQSVLDTLLGRSVQHVVSDYLEVASRVGGTLFSLPGGEVRAAVAGEYRRESYDSSSGNVYTSGTPSAPLLSAGGRDIWALSAELRLPVVSSLNALPGLQALEASASLRYDHYEAVGATLNPKVGLRWSPVRGVSFRGSWGTSFKAPRLESMLRPRVVSFAALPTGFGGPDPNRDGLTSLLFLQGGNPDITSERGEAWTIGADVVSEKFPGLRLSATYFDLHFDDRITPSPGFIVILGNPTPFAGSVYFAAPSQAQVDAAVNAAETVQGVPPPGGVEAIIDTRETNLSTVDLRGLDFEANYRFGLVGGQVTAVFQGTYYIDYVSRITPIAPPLPSVDVVASPMDFRLRGGVSWSRGRFSAGLYANYLDGYLNNTVNPKRRVKSSLTFDLNAGYRFDEFALPRGLGKGLSVLLTASNLFDRDPPFAQVGSYGFDSTNYSPVGRLVALEVRKSW